MFTINQFPPLASVADDSSLTLVLEISSIVLVLLMIGVVAVLIRSYSKHQQPREEESAANVDHLQGETGSQTSREEG